MAELILHFIAEPGADLAATSAAVSQYVTDLAGPDNVFVESEQPRLGPAEILTILQIGAMGVDAAKQLIAWWQHHREHVRGIDVEIDGHRVPIDQLTDDQRARLEALLHPSTS